MRIIVFLFLFLSAPALRISNPDLEMEVASLPYNETLYPYLDMTKASLTYNEVLKGAKCELPDGFGLPVLHEDGCQKLQLFPPVKKFRDGVWPICYDVVQPGNGCVVLSAGAYDDISFDIGLAKTGCKVHTFDPTLEQIAKDRAPRASHVAQQAEDNGIHLYDAGFFGENKTYAAGEMPYTWPGVGYGTETNTKPWRMVTLGGALKEIGQSRIDLLKFDIEGGEWAFLEEALSNPPIRKKLSEGQIQQIDLEVHFMPPRGTGITKSPRHPQDTKMSNQKYTQILNDLESIGFQMVWHEPNGQCCHNIALVWQQ